MRLRQSSLLLNGSNVTNAFKRNSCSGTIIDEETILTASHCFFQGTFAVDLSRSSIKIHAGITKVGSSARYLDQMGMLSAPNFGMAEKWESSGG